jgi:hypothetical protein
MPQPFQLPLPPRLQVNRGACRYKNPRRPHPPLRASRVSRRLPSPTAVRSTNRLSLRGSILGPWPARPKWAPTTVSFLGCIVHDRQSTLNMALTLTSIAFPSPRLIFSFLQSLSLSPFAVCRSWSAVLPSASTLSLRFVVTLHCTRAIPALLLPLPPPLPSPPLDKSKTHRRGLPPNSRGE